MKRLTELALMKIKGNHKAMGRLVHDFNKHYRTIEIWLDDNDVRLTTPGALEIIREETGLTDDQILEDTPTEAVKEG